MKNPKKSIQIKFLLAKINTFLNYQDFGNADMRRGAATALESALHEANVYWGFAYTDGASGKIDDSRRKYFTHPHLQK